MFGFIKAQKSDATSRCLCKDGFMRMSGGGGLSLRGNKMTVAISYFVEDLLGLLRYGGGGQTHSQFEELMVVCYLIC